MGMLNPERIWHLHRTDLSTSSVIYSHFTLGNPKKVIFQHYYSSIIIQIIYVTSEENK